MKRASFRCSQFLLVLFFLLTLSHNPIRVEAQPASVEIYLPSITRSALHWQKMTNGLPDDWVRDILINPSSPHEILIAYRNSGIYKSSDHGQSWNEVWGFSQATGPNVRQLAVSTSNPNVLYATALNRVLRSTDRGETWADIWPVSNPGGGWAVSVDQDDPDHVFIGINATVPNNVYETEDGGLNWEAKNLSVGATEGIISLAFDPFVPGKIYAGGNTDLSDNPRITRLYVSTDSGDNWMLMENDFPATKRVMNIHFNPCNPRQVYISRQGYNTSDDFHRRSDDSGSTWVTLPLSDDDLFISPVSPCPIYSDIQRSLDNGVTWKNLSADLYLLIPDPVNLRYSAWVADPWSNVLWLGTRYHGVFYMNGVVPHSPGN